MRKWKALLIFWAAALLWGAASEPVRARNPDGDVVIVIDAGHGGHDPGSVAVTGACEKDCNLAIALAMKEELGKYQGVTVYLTRSDDQWLTNMGRAMTAASLKADFLISIHNNSGAQANSGCVAYRSLNPYYSESTDKMCRLITDNLAALGFRNGGVQTRPSTQYAGEDYYTLIGEGVRAGVPSIIVENCFLSNPEDAARLTNADKTVNEEMAGKMGAANAKAVAEYFGLSLRTAAADSETAVTLQKGNSVALFAPGNTGSSAAWRSSDPAVATVDENGVVKAVGAGNAKIVCTLGDGSAGTCTIHVEQPAAVALTGCLDPTFYESMADFAAIKLDGVFAFVSYSDGSAVRVTPKLTGNLDRSKVGIQDIGIEYDGLTGFLRVCNTSAPYLPEVTLPQRTDDPGQSAANPQGTDGSGTQGEPKTDASNALPSGKEKGNVVGELVKYIAVLFGVVLIGIVLLVFENGRRRKKKSRRAGRRY